MSQSDVEIDITVHANGGDQGGAQHIPIPVAPANAGGPSPSIAFTMQFPVDVPGGTIRLTFRTVTDVNDQTGLPILTIVFPTNTPQPAGGPRNYTANVSFPAANLKVGDPVIVSVVAPKPSTAKFFIGGTAMVAQ